ncbi:hypothetical protein [Nocardia sp. XZ_19_369]|uniref:hypothetical protein n=1 Tax=Nocardia sp. XZ_19_369 TaxID=2769487 RepID=UPI00188F7B3D|nr:hypothetical protein [Nocardia sp. XZ_19_369]
MISAPIYEDSVVDRVCYLGVDYATGEEVEISETEALEQTMRTVGAFAGTRMLQKINTRDNIPVSVNYFDITDPEATLKWHSKKFPTAIGRAWSAYERSTTGARRVGCSASPGSSKIAELTIELLSTEDELLSEERQTPDGRLIERVEYSYDGDGEISETRVYDSGNTLIQVDRHDE